jgi:hypothetical protein
METSTYLARLIGPVLAVIGVSMLLNPGSYLAIATAMLQQPALLYFAAVVGLVGGVALVMAHNVWAADWRLILTLLGWISIVDSASWILLTEQLRALWAPALTGAGLPLAGGVIVLLLGAALCFYGYFATNRIRRHP